jgi:hypothetical protein
MEKITVGSEKQIVWAKQIRDKAFSNYKPAISSNLPVSEKKAKYNAILELRLELARGVIDSKFWIHHKNFSINDIITSFEPERFLIGEITPEQKAKAIELKKAIENFK